MGFARRRPDGEQKYIWKVWECALAIPFIGCGRRAEDASWRDRAQVGPALGLSPHITETREPEPPRKGVNAKPIASRKMLMYYLINLMIY